MAGTGTVPTENEEDTLLDGTTFADGSVRLGQYKGIMTWSSELDEIGRIAIRDDDIWVCSFPRSGTTLTQELTYLIATRDFTRARTEELDARFPIIDVRTDKYPFYKGLKHITEMSSPRFVKTHFRYDLLPEQLRTGKGKVIYVARHPLDCLASYYRLMRWYKMLTIPFTQFFENIMSGEKVANAPWWSHVKEFWEHRDDGNILFLRFEDIVKDMPAVIKKISDFLGKPICPGEVVLIADHCKLENMKANKNVNQTYQNSLVAKDTQYGEFINTGKSGMGTNLFTAEMVDRLMSKVRTEFAGTGLSFDI